MKNFVSHTSSSAFELPAAQLKNLLADAVTPKLPGFIYNGAYIWYSSWEDHCRKVIQVYPLKGASAVFQWGLCFDFLPVFGESGNLRYQRTDKSVGLHLFCWPPGHWDAVAGRKSSCRFSRFGQNYEDVEAQLFSAFREAQEFFIPWFQNCYDLKSALNEAEHQRTDPGSRFNWPNPGYVTAFLLAANGDASTGTKVLEEFWAKHCQQYSPDLYNKLQAKLLACVGYSNI